MPNCFTLTRKSDPAVGPVKLQQIDDEMRVYFGAPPDAEYWYHYWYDIIGLALAMGRTLDELKDRYSGRVKGHNGADLSWDEGLAIVNWLSDNFTTDAWYQPK